MVEFRGSVKRSMVRARLAAVSGDEVATFLGVSFASNIFIPRFILLNI